MTVTVNFAAVANSIAGLTVSGVTMRDIDQIPDAADMIYPVMFPQPNNFITDISPVFQSFGSNGTAKIDMSYTLNYVYIHAPAGSGISAFDSYSGLITNLAAIMVTMLSNDVLTGAIDNIPQAITAIDVIEDPAGNSYWGALLSYRILELVN